MRRLSAAVALALGMVGCGPFSDDVDGPSADITAAVDQADDTGQRFRLADATDFDWDRFYAFDAYTPQERIDNRLGFHWDAGDSASAGSDGVVLLVFVRDGKVVRAYDQDYGHGVFSCLPDRGLAPAQATFRVQRYSEGDELYRVVRARGRLAPGCPF